MPPRIMVKPNAGEREELRAAPKMFGGNEIRPDILLRKG
jgi:hypothetical protein